MKKHPLSFFLILYAWLCIMPITWGQLADSTLQKLQTAPNDTSKVNMLNDAAKSLLYTDVRSGMEYARSAGRLAQELNFKSGLALSYYLMGYYHRFQGNLDSCEIYFIKSGNLFKELNNGKGESIILSAMAGLYQDKQEYNKALYLFFEGLKTDRRLGDQKGESIDLLNIALVFAQLKRYNEAEDYFLQSARIKLELGDTRGVSFVYVNLGSMLVDQKRWNEAGYYLEKVYADQKDQKNTRLLAVCQMSLGSVYVHQNKYKEAEEMELAAISFYEQTADSNGLATAYNLLGRVYLNENKLPQARNYYLKAFEILNHAQNTTPITTTYEGLYEVSKRTGEYKDALFYLEALQKLNAQTYQLQVAEEITRQKEKFQAEKLVTDIQLLEEQNKNARAKARQQKIRFILLLVTGGLVFVILCFIIVLIVSRNKHLKKIKELELLKTRAQLEQKALRAQMNPHFIFNSLNSIQHYILSNQTEYAYDYLASFSSLIRQVLSNSEHSTILLRKEIEWLQTYIELEQKRFQNRFSFELVCDPAIQTDEVEIPVMLIQPFVENSLWHGIMNLPKGQQGHLLLSFMLQSSWLVITVQDNGVGREASGKLNSKHGQTSVGILFTQKRLETLKSSGGNEARVEVTDLYDNNRVACGTRVTIFIQV